MAVKVQCVLHPFHELPALLRDAPRLVPPGLESVFQALTHRLPRYALYIAQFHSLVLKQLQRPVRMTLWKVAARYGYKLRPARSPNLRFRPGRDRSINAL